jgi:two-component system phosphate regulon response regulator PhoB
MAQKVLVIDDDPDVRYFSVTSLEEAGLIVLEAGDGAEGRAMAKAEIPDLILLDVMMPRESGIRLYRDLKTDVALRHIPIVILSGIGEKSFLKSQQALVEEGQAPVPAPAAYLEKPVPAETLITVIQRILGRKEQPSRS